MSRQKGDPYLKACFEEEKRLFPDEPKKLTRRDEIRLRTYVDRYAKTCSDLKLHEERKRKLGELLQQEMERQGVTKAEGSKASVTLISGDRITRVNSLQFYNAMSEQFKPKAWNAMSVLIEKARALVGEQTLRDLGKAVPFTRLVAKWYGENDGTQDEEQKEAA